MGRAKQNQEKRGETKLTRFYSMVTKSLKRKKKQKQMNQDEIDGYEGICYTSLLPEVLHLIQYRNLHDFQL